MEGRRRTGVNAARLVMLVLAVVTGWGAVTAAGPGHFGAIQLAGPPAAVVTAAPAPLETEDAAAVVGKQDANGSRTGRTRPASRSRGPPRPALHHLCRRPGGRARPVPAGPGRGVRLVRGRRRRRGGLRLTVTAPAART